MKRLLTLILSWGFICCAALLFVPSTAKAQVKGNIYISSKSSCPLKSGTNINPNVNTCFDISQTDNLSFSITSASADQPSFWMDSASTRKTNLFVMGSSSTYYVRIVLTKSSQYNALVPQNIYFNNYLVATIDPADSSEKIHVADENPFTTVTGDKSTGFYAINIKLQELKVNGVSSYQPVGCWIPISASMPDGAAHFCYWTGSFNYGNNYSGTVQYEDSQSLDTKVYMDNSLAGISLTPIFPAPGQVSYVVGRPASKTVSGRIDKVCDKCGRVIYVQCNIACIDDMALNCVKFQYNGKAKKPGVTVIDRNGNVIPDNYYDVTYPSGRKTVGKYTVSVTMKDRYTGTLSKSFQIYPATPTISSLTSGTRKLTVKAAARPSAMGASNYKIGYKQKGTSKWKYITTTSQSKTISSLKKGKQYYVKIQAYKQVGTKTYYGAWTATKLSKKIK